MVEISEIPEPQPMDFSSQHDGDTVFVDAEEPESTVPAIPNSETPDIAVPQEQKAQVTLNNLGPVSGILLQLMRGECGMVDRILSGRLKGHPNTETMNQKRLRKAAGLFVSFGHYIPQIQNNSEAFSNEELHEIHGRAKRCLQLLDTSFVEK
jgi:hypothetical protein